MQLALTVQSSAAGRRLLVLYSTCIVGEIENKPTFFFVKQANLLCKARQGQGKHCTHLRASDATVTNSNKKGIHENDNKKNMEKGNSK